jgi:hypothetical protein
MDFAAPNREVDIFKRLNPGKTLRETTNLKQRFVFNFHGRIRADSKNAGQPWRVKSETRALAFV